MDVDLAVLPDPNYVVISAKQVFNLRVLLPLPPLLDYTSNSLTIPSAKPNY